MFRYALAAAVMAAASVVYGQAEIEEATPAAVIIPQQHSSTSSTASNSSGRSDQLSQLFYKMQLLEQQVQELTGLVEEQQYEIRRLKKQRMDDVVSMDRRLSRLEGGTPGTETSVSVISDSSPRSSLGGSTTGGNVAVTKTTPLSPSSSDRDVYQAAYQLVKQRQYEQALPALEGYLEQFPMGEYAPNTHYWIGALYVLENNLEKAREWFSLLVNRYPEHNKAESAKFSLAKVYHRLGDVEQAKTLLSDVAAGSSVVASQAQRYLASELTE